MEKYIIESQAWQSADTPPPPNPVNQFLDMTDEEPGAELTSALVEVMLDQGSDPLLWGGTARYHPDLGWLSDGRPFVLGKVALWRYLPVITKKERG